MSASNTMKAIQVHDASKAQATSLHWTSVPIPKLSSNQVLVRVKAFGLNRMDILQRMGLYPVPPGASHIIGIEFSGIVEDANGQCDWENGDQVFGLTTGGAYAELVAVHPRLLVKKASKLTWVQAAAIPEVWLTAFQTAIDIGGLSKGQNILVHAGASGVGTSAIQLAHLYGAANIFTTAGSPEKTEYLEKKMGATKAFNYKKDDWAQGILDATNGKGVDVVLDFVGPGYWDGNLKALARDGRIVLIGLLSGTKTSGPTDISPILFKRARIEGTTLRSRTIEYQEDLLQRFARAHLSDLLSEDPNSKLQLVIDKVFDAKQIVDATQYMEAASNIGKIVCEITSDL